MLGYLGELSSSRINMKETARMPCWQLLDDKVAWWSSLRRGVNKKKRGQQV